MDDELLKKIGDVCLSDKVSVADYHRFETNEDKNEIAKFIQDRFTERYITPLRRDDVENKHGFCTMAICCLMIETLESFWQGWEDTNNIEGKKVFEGYFNRSTKLTVFKDTDFYKGVRCGILHQAETTNGWRIRRGEDEPLFDPSTKMINATKFHNRLEMDLKHYCEQLRQSDWDSDIWKNLRKKMHAIIDNCLTEEND